MKKIHDFSTVHFFPEILFFFFLNTGKKITCVEVSECFFFFHFQEGKKKSCVRMENSDNIYIFFTCEKPN